MALRITFGGSPRPSMWGYTSETITDICNTLIQSSSWVYSTIYDEISDTIPQPICLSDDIPFVKSKELAVHLPINDLGKVDVFINDNIAVTPDLGQNITRVIQAIPLGIHSLSRSVDLLDDLPRVDFISAKKLQAEGTFKEVKVVLGWVINTRSLLISLPLDRHTKWSLDISKMISSRETSHDFLESTIGRLNHVAGIIPMLRHFLG
jgi:hypothetical protein